MKKKKKHRNLLHRSEIKRYTPVSLQENQVTHYIYSKNNKLIDKNLMQSCRVLITREIRKAKLSMRKQRLLWIFPDYQLPFTKKGTNSRMGKGKGAIDKYKSHVQKNDMIFMIKKLNSSSVKKISDTLSRKLSFNFDVVKNDNKVLSKVKS